MLRFAADGCDRLQAERCRHQRPAEHGELVQESDGRSDVFTFIQAHLHIFVHLTYQWRAMPRLMMICNFMMSALICFI